MLGAIEIALANGDHIPQMVHITNDNGEFDHSLCCQKVYCSKRRQKLDWASHKQHLMIKTVNLNFFLFIMIDNDQFLAST